jgi:methylenetetrahydrofolate dehydrogenase (NADP+)/methenyltetrahydrofolate cyclohydrolase
MMSARILDGADLAWKIEEEVRANIEFWSRGRRPRPTLHVLLTSQDPASSIYVKRKQKACERVGIDFHLDQMSGENLPERIKMWLDLKRDQEGVHGVLVQLPLPNGCDRLEVFDQIPPTKDVDVFHPQNVGLLMQGRPYLEPCTPQGIHALLVHNFIKLPGKKAVVINRSDVVGKALHGMLIQDHDLANATVTLCHDNTPPKMLKDICLDADIIVVAVGIPGFLTADMVSEKAVIVDVGINRKADGKICGDVDFGPVSEKVQAISPVPGGVGPLTVACMLRNVYKACKRQTE